MATDLEQILSDIQRYAWSINSIAAEVAKQSDWHPSWASEPERVADYLRQALSDLKYADRTLVGTLGDLRDEMIP